MPMSPRLLRPRASGPGAIVAADADARAYIAAVNTADGQPLEVAVQQAIDAFVIGCKTNGIWSAIKASCILMGARTLSGALTPLVGAAPTPVNFAAGDYNRRTGLVGNGSTKYINSNRNSNADPQNSHHLSVYISVATMKGSSSCIIGAGGYNNNGSTRMAFPFGDSYGFFNNRSNNYVDAPSSLTVGLTAINRENSAGFSARWGASGSATTTLRGSSAPQAVPTFVFADSGTTGTPQEHSPARLAFYSIGESINMAQLNTRVSALYAAIGAGIP